MRRTRQKRSATFLDGSYLICVVGVHLAHRARVSRAYHHEGADPDVLLVHPRRVSSMFMTAIVVRRRHSSNQS